MRKTLSVRFAVCIVLLTVSAMALQKGGQPAVGPRPGASQTPVVALPAGAPGREAVLRLFDALQLRKLMADSLKQMREQLNADIPLMLEREGIEPTEQEVRFMGGLMDSTFQSVSVDELLEAIVPVYQRHFTQAELNAAIAFYTTPVGRKMLAEQPKLLTETMHAIRPIQERLMEAMATRLQDHVRESMEEKKKSNTSK